MPCPAANPTNRGIIHILPLLVLAVVILAGLAIFTRSSQEDSKDVLGASTQKVQTHTVLAKRTHNVFGIKVTTSVTNLVDDAGNVLEVKPSLTDRIVGLLD
ncbi:MAG: hypothetical protein AAB599_01185 [Patescibacteria group bacterium]